MVTVYTDLSGLDCSKIDDDIVNIWTNFGAHNRWIQAIHKIIWPWGGLCTSRRMLKNVDIKIENYNIFLNSFEFWLTKT